MTIRVMLVDDAVVVRHVLSDTLSKDPDIEVVGTAADGVLAMQRLEAFAPDVVVLDVEMPNMDGIETLAAIKKQRPQTRVIMFSTLTSRGAAATMDAMMLGAEDYVTKPANVGSMSAAIERINSELTPKIKALAGRRTDAVIAASPAPKLAPAPAPAPTPSDAPNGAFSINRPTAPAASANGPAPIGVPRPIGTGKPQILAIAVSTGGPNALAALLPQLPADLAVPVVIVQHIPAMFSKALADRLDSKSQVRVAEGEAGAVLKPGEVWLAPGDFHMTVRRDGNVVRLDTNQGPPENSCRPAADVLFRSVVATYGPATLGLVLTGMGNDGQKGAQEIVRVGGRVIAQDEASSVVWGMPGSVVNTGLAERVLPLDQIASELVSRLGTSRVTASSQHP